MRHKDAWGKLAAHFERHTTNEGAQQLTSQPRPHRIQVTR